MKFTRAIALCGLTLAIALAIGAISPYQPYASAGDLRPIILIATNTPTLPTPALPTAPPEQLAAAPPELPPAAPPELPPAAPPELPPAAPPELPPAAPADAPAEIPAAAVDQSLIPGTAEFNAALAETYRNLPTAGPMPEPRPYATMTAAQQQYSRQRTR
jgi:hypothetical protein